MPHFYPPGAEARDEGTRIKQATAFDFVGAGVVVTDGGDGIATVTISGAGSGAPANASYITAVAEAGLSNETLVSTVSGYGVVASIPSASSVPTGSLYAASDQNKIYRSNGTTWDIAVTGSGVGTLLAANNLSDVANALTSFNNISPLTTRGDLLTRDASNNVRLAVGAANRVLRSNGTDPSWAQVALATDVSGTLPVGNGGTGQTTLAVHGVVVGNAASGVNVTGTGTSGQVLTSNGASADPTFQTPSAATTNADMTVGFLLGGM